MDQFGEDFDEDISGFVADLLSGKEDISRPELPLHAMSLRIPLELAAYVIVMAESGDKSRNEMARLLMQAGVDSVLSRLPQEVAVDTRQAAFERYKEMI
jgi:hypothetical protein